jgi:hypothetical protein
MLFFNFLGAATLAEAIFQIKEFFDASPHM